jgi:hypothetical protein
MSGKQHHAFKFQEVKPDVLQSLRQQLGLKEWGAQKQEDDA